MSSKEDILKELLLTEEDTLEKLKTLIEKTKALVKIDQKTNKIVISTKFGFSNPEKILLFLIGKYFSKELDLCEKEGMDIQELEKESGIKRTTLSRPLGGLSYSGYITQDAQKKYLIHHYKIEETVQALHDKFMEQSKGAQGIKIKYKPSNKPKKGGERNER